MPRQWEIENQFWPMYKPCQEHQLEDSLQRYKRDIAKYQCSAYNTYRGDIEPSQKLDDWIDFHAQSRYWSKKILHLGVGKFPSKDRGDPRSHPPQYSESLTQSSALRKKLRNTRLDRFGNDKFLVENEEPFYTIPAPPHTLCPQQSAKAAYLPASSERSLSQHRTMKASAPSPEARTYILTSQPASLTASPPENYMSDLSKQQIGPLALVPRNDTHPTSQQQLGPLPSVSVVATQNLSLRHLGSITSTPVEVPEGHTPSPLQIQPTRCVPKRAYAAGDASSRHTDNQHTKRIKIESEQEIRPQVINVNYLATEQANDVLQQATYAFHKRSAKYLNNLAGAMTAQGFQKLLLDEEGLHRKLLANMFCVSPGQVDSLSEDEKQAYFAKVQEAFTSKPSASNSLVQTAAAAQRASTDIVFGEAGPSRS
ncbi:hypothetical protein B0J14DRAFT_646229 [Halenospora varia]|nr:hypothetical protein B0J14DRAFT_646229 [Halenospora varia]